MRTVCIAGSHPDTREQAPYDDPSIEIWVFNEAMTAPWCKRWDVAFQLHDEVIYTNPFNRCDTGHWDYLKSDHPGKTIYMREFDARVPACKVYPLEEIQSLLKSQRMFTSTPAMAIALAIHQGYEKIIITGIEMASETEYQAQRDAIAYWVGFAQGAGVEVELQSAKNIFTRPIYGYEGLIFQRVEDYTERGEELRKMRYKALDEIKDAEWQLRRAWNTPDKVTEALLRLQNAQIAHGRIEGADGENTRYQEKVEAMQRVSGNAILDRNEFESAQAANQEQVTKKEAEMNVSRGMLEYALGIWRQTGFKMDALDNVKRFLKPFADTSYNAGLAAGRRDENLRLKLQLDQRLKMAGGEKSLEAVKELA